MWTTVQYKANGHTTVLRPDILYIVQPYLQNHHIMLFSEVVVGQSSNFRTLRPLCPTRLTVSVDAIMNVVCQYECILDALEAFVEPSRGASTESKTRANGLLYEFKMSSTLLALRVALVGLASWRISVKHVYGC
jgi:hypothetical protein